MGVTPSSQCAPTVRSTSLALSKKSSMTAAVVMATTGAAAILSFTTTALSASTMFVDPEGEWAGGGGALYVHYTWSMYPYY